MSVNAVGLSQRHACARIVSEAPRAVTKHDSVYARWRCAEAAHLSRRWRVLRCSGCGFINEAVDIRVAIVELQQGILVT